MEVIPFSPEFFGSENINRWHLSHLPTALTTPNEKLNEKLSFKRQEQIPSLFAAVSLSRVILGGGGAKGEKG